MQPIWAAATRRQSSPSPKLDTLTNVTHSRGSGIKNFLVQVLSGRLEQVSQSNIRQVRKFEKDFQNYCLNYPTVVIIPGAYCSDPVLSKTALINQIGDFETVRTLPAHTFFPLMHKVIAPRNSTQFCKSLFDACYASLTTLEREDLSNN